MDVATRGLCNSYNFEGGVDVMCRMFLIVKLKNHSQGPPFSVLGSHFR